jgi:endonuclease YncB( thermonuclease family)
MFPKRVTIAGYVSILFVILLFLAGLFLTEKEVLPKIKDVTKELSPLLTPSPRPSPTITFQKIQGASDSAHMVSEVLDGDTFDLANGDRVRLLGVNAPEKGQPYSAQSIQVLKEFVLGRQLRLESDTKERDQYSRLLSYVYVGDRMVNEELVRRGVAIVETVPPNTRHEERLKTAQRDARANCEGLWQGLCENKSSACIVIDSIESDAVGDDNKNKNGEWVELRNTCTQNVNMAGYLLKDNSASNYFIFPAFVLPSQKKVSIYSGCGQNIEDKLYWKCPEVRSSIWNNDHDNAYLYNELDVLIADFGY